jgi:hypothetical protein
MDFEDQAFSLSYDLAPYPSPPPSSGSSTGDTQENQKERPVADEKGGKGRGKEPSHTTAIPPGPL